MSTEETDPQNEIQQKKQLLRFKAKVARALNMTIDQLDVVDTNQTLTILNEIQKLDEEHRKMGLYSEMTFSFSEEQRPALDALFLKLSSSQTMFLSIGFMPLYLIRMRLYEIFAHALELVELASEGIFVYSLEQSSFSLKCLRFSKYSQAEGMIFKLRLEGGGWFGYFERR